MARPKRKSEPQSTPGAKRQKQAAEGDGDLRAFIDSTLKLVTGMPTAADFLKLPPKKVLPDYYDVVKSPISIHEIKQKANSNGYTTAQDFLADFELMADNANTYNVEESQIAKDAILIRDFVKDQVAQFAPDQVSKGADEDEEMADQDEDEDEDEEYEEGGDSPPPSKQPKRDSTPAKSGLKIRFKPITQDTPATPGTPSTPNSAGGMTQKARFLMVLDELMNYEAEGARIGESFTNEVDRRDLPDYYKIVKKPMALQTVKDNILAGKVKSMGQFQNQVELVWKNAQLYNEPGSLLYSDSLVLQDYFRTRMAQINREIEAARVAQLQQRGETPTTGSGLKLKIKAPKTKLSLTVHNRESGGLPIPSDLELSGVNPLTGEAKKEESESSDDEDDEEEEEPEATEEDAKLSTPAVKLPSTKPREVIKPASEKYIQEIIITSSRSLYKQYTKPTGAPGSASNPNYPMKYHWFEHKFLASDVPTSTYVLSLQRQQGAVSVSAGLNDSLIKKKHHATLSVNGERVNPVPSIHYADSGRQLTSRFELKLPLGLSLVVFDVAVEDGLEDARTRAQEAASIKTEKLTFWIQVL